MAYRLRTEEPVGHGLRRVVRRELRRAAEALAESSSADALHNARKRIKKARSVLHLVERHMKTGDAERELRKANRLLGPLRDSEAIIASAHAALHQRQKIAAHLWQQIDRSLHRQRERLRTRSRADKVAPRVRKALARVRKASASWKWDAVDEAALAKEVRRAHKKAKQAMAQAAKSDDAADFHAWRKRVKTLWHGVRLLQERTPMPALVKDLKTLETLLGEEHNLQVLQARLPVMPLRAKHEARALCIRCQRRLRRQALLLGRRSFAATPAAGPATH